MTAARGLTVQNDIGSTGAALGPVFNDGGPIPRILVVEDERIVALDIAATLNQLGYAVAASVGSGPAAVKEAVRLRPNLVLMDIRLAGDMDGVQAAEAIQAEIDVPIIYLTAHSDDPTLARAKKTCPAGYVVKPFRAADLHCAIELALHKQEIEASLRERERWLANTLQAIRDGVVGTVAAKRLESPNPVAHALTGWHSEEAVARVADDILTSVREKSRPRLGPLDGDWPKKTTRAAAVIDGLVSKNGQSIPGGGPVVAVLGDAGEVPEGVMAFRHTTERGGAEEEIQKLNALLEQSVVERTTQLEAANRELESFSYSIAQDLRAPLRGIDGFSAMLIENHTANLGPEGLACLNRIRAGVKRMRRLIDDLLHLAHIARHDYRRQKVNLTEISTKIAAELQAEHQGRKVHFLVQDGISVEGDSQLLRIVLQNLLSNAWKFTSKIAAPRIEVGSFESDGRRVCFVRDNGSGFDMKYADKLFLRLPSAEGFEGTGVGLAIVERIIHRHGGRIWAESAPNKGATFFFMV
jgi:signal transduction histidine kinase/DNA-binding NarL/FixJ family response regulator